MQPILKITQHYSWLPDIKILSVNVIVNIKLGGEWLLLLHGHVVLMQLSYYIYYNVYGQDFTSGSQLTAFIMQPYQWTKQKKNTKRIEYLEILTLWPLLVFGFSVHFGYERFQDWVESLKKIHVTLICSNHIKICREFF